MEAPGGQVTTRYSYNPTQAKDFVCLSGPPASTTGTTQTCVNATQPQPPPPPTPPGTGLDTGYPYSTGTSTQDSPTISLDSSKYVTESRSFSADMYFLWDPVLPSNCSPGITCTSIPVPLGSVNWGFSGSASYSAGSWTLTTNSKVTPAWTPSSSYPKWNDYVPYSGVILCQ